jgi:hypothetical protein
LSKFDAATQSSLIMAGLLGARAFDAGSQQFNPAQ